MTLTVNTPLLSTGTFTISQFVAAVASHTPRTQYSDDDLRRIATRTIYWCQAFGMNHDLVLSQMVHETDWFRFTGDVKFGQHNFAGLGATGGVPGHSFPLDDGLIQDDGIEAGVLAVVAHHAVYRWGDKSRWPAHLQQYADNNVDPRYSAALGSGNAGRMIVLGDYRGTWAVPGRTYPESLITRSRQIDVFLKGEDMASQIPGFAWQPADSNHYQRGRSQRIRGGAQHYTAGTNSLAWLTRTSNPPVSATFLVKHNPTLNDRGWQLVRIEDTAWTTAFANPYTVSIEYEHTGSGAIPTIAYEVLAQTWIDIAAYVKAHNLGEIPLDRSGIRGHREWVNNPALTCPDGIDLDRLVTEIQRRQGAPEPDDALYLPHNPYGAVPIVMGFRSMFMEMGAARYPDDAIAGGLSLFGYPIGPEYPTPTGSAQEFERAVFKYETGKSAPWDVVVALRSEGLPERRGA